MASRAELLFSEVLNALHLLVERKSRSSMHSSGVNVPQSAHHLADLEVMLHEEKLEFEVWYQFQASSFIIYPECHVSICLYFNL